MRILVAGAACALALPAAGAQDGFDACAVFTQAEAEQVMEATATDEPSGKARRPRLVTACTYRGFKEGKPVEASAQFRFSRSESEAQRVFDEARMDHQTKPLIISGSDAFWAGRAGQMNILKGRAWITLSVGPEVIREREIEPAKRLAEVLVKKM